MEFQATEMLLKSGFRVFQGEYAKTSDGTPRELDVLATLTSKREDILLRVNHVIECKYSKDKPWVVFCSNSQPMMSSAIAAQSIGSSLGSAIVWSIAGHKEVTSLELFKNHSKSGFGGRVAFDNKRDVFYRTVQSVVQNSFSVAERYGEYPQEGILPEHGILVFPIILVEGNIFNAHYDAEKGKTVLEETNHARCHWRGSNVTSFHSTVDIVTLNSFEGFMKQRYDETCSLIKMMEDCYDRILKCGKTKSLEPLEFQSSPRGILGAPPLLCDLIGATDSK